MDIWSTVEISVEFWVDTLMLFDLNETYSAYEIYQDRYAANKIT